MNAPLITEDLETVLAGMSVPGYTLWNRLEGRPRADDFRRALRAEVRDPLWMLSRQWQLGEFGGDDAGSPVTAKVRVDASRLRWFRPADGTVVPFDDRTPLDVRVEQLPVPMREGGIDTALDLRLLAGRYWLKLVRSIAPAAEPQYVATYPVYQPDPDNPADAPICAHPEAWAGFAAAAGRLMDGVRFYEHLTRGGGNASDGIGAVAAQRAAVDALGNRFVTWFNALIAQPGDDPAWEPDRMEYRFSVAAHGQRVFVADEYYQARLDWYNLDIDPSATLPVLPPPAEPPQVLSVMPTPVTFDGMPNTRWWSFEDGRTNFGDIAPDTTDLAKLLLIEFGLVYANDWYHVPFTLPAGVVATVRGVAVSNVFGERIWVEPAAGATPQQWRRWTMFLHSAAGDARQPAELSLAVLPVAQHVLQGPVREEVALARDETANLVWAIEKTIALPTGETRPGAEAAHETRQYFDRDYARRTGHPPRPPAAAAGANLRYELMNSMPEHWIPMVGRHVPGDSRQIQLQRAAMARTYDGDPDPPTAVRPRTSLLRTGLDADPPVAYLVHEEEVSRAGVRVTQAFRRARGMDGRAWVWLGARKQTGRGEASSALAFDQVVDAPATPAE